MNTDCKRELRAIDNDIPSARTWKPYFGVKNRQKTMLTAIETMEINTGSFSLSIEKNVAQTPYIFHKKEVQKHNIVRQVMFFQSHASKVLFQK